MYDALFTPFNIGPMTLKNRFIVSAAVTRLSNPDNTLSEAFIRYQEDKAKGGWAMIITEDMPVTNDAMTFPCLAGIYDDSQIPGHKELTRRVHDAGAKMCAQLYHPGAASKRAITHQQPKAPSAVRNQAYAEIPQELTTYEIHDIVKAFGRAALRAKESGYDAVEIHAAHGYLIHQFLSANTNKRTDEYGGSLVNRNRFMREVIQEVRSQVGPEFPVQVRISAEDLDEYGVTIEESMITARIAEQASADAIHCSNGDLKTNDVIIPPAVSPRALFVKNAAAIKTVVKIPVIAVGRINEPALAENAILTNRADFVTMFRASLADPELPNKLKEGRLEEINYCIGCMQGCSGSNYRLTERFSCLVRPMTGYAHELPVVPAEVPKKLAIIGGGISGCEAAIYAAMRGHKVTVFEKTDRLGGRWIAASTPPGKAGYTTFINWQKAMLAKYGVEIRLNTEVTVEMMERFAPDEIILAAGADDFIPNIPGAKSEHVVLAQDVLRSRAAFGDNVVVIGGGLVGAETAEYIAVYGGKKVTIVEMLPAICSDGEPVPTRLLLKSFKEHDVDVYTNASVSEITPDYVTFKYKGEEIRVKADTVVMATGIRPNDSLYNALKDAGYKVTKVGDSASGKNGLKNIREGFMAGLHI